MAVNFFTFLKIFCTTVQAVAVKFGWMVDGCH